MTFSFAGGKSSVSASEVRFADASLGLWPTLRLTVRKPELAEPGGFARGAAFSAEAVDLELDVFALVGFLIWAAGFAFEGLDHVGGIGSVPIRFRPRFVSTHR